jgi:hypothetical protein
MFVSANANSPSPSEMICPLWDGCLNCHQGNENLGAPPPSPLFVRDTKDEIATTDLKIAAEVYKLSASSVSMLNTSKCTVNRVQKFFIRQFSLDVHHKCTMNRVPKVLAHAHAYCQECSCLLPLRAMFVVNALAYCH